MVSPIRRRSKIERWRKSWRMKRIRVEGTRKHFPLSSKTRGTSWTGILLGRERSPSQPHPRGLLFCYSPHRTLSLWKPIWTSLREKRESAEWLRFEEEEVEVEESASSCIFASLAVLGQSHPILSKCPNFILFCFFFGRFRHLLFIHSLILWKICPIET